MSDIHQLYDKLKSIFQEYTTYNWKNGWQGEGDRQSTELKIQKNVPCNNLFLLHSKRYNEGFYLQGPQGFRLEVELHDKISEGRNLIRIDISARQINDSGIFYYVSNELDWQASVDFLVDLCQTIYDANVKIRKALDPISNEAKWQNIKNPEFIKKFRRDRLLDELI